MNGGLGEEGVRRRWGFGGCRGVWWSGCAEGGIWGGERGEVATWECGGWEGGKGVGLGGRWGFVKGMRVASGVFGA